MSARRRGARLALGVALCAALGLGCAGTRLPPPEGGSVSVEPERALDFHRSAARFYSRFLKRRFNTLETFSDPVLRQHFASLDLFFDYYADLAQSFSGAHFEKSRPVEVQLQEFLFEDPDRVRIQVRFVGLDGRPLRPGWSSVTRRDRWERADGKWVVLPGRL